MLPELKRLNRLLEKDRRRYLKTCSGPFVDCLCECVKNVLKGRVQLKPKQLEQLRPHKKLLRKLPSRKTPRTERRRILQKGGFLPAILPPIISAVGSLFGPILGRLIAGSKNRNGER